MMKRDEIGYAPLPHEYMLIGIIGFFISIFYIYNYSRSWGFALGLFCMLLVIASLVSASKAGLDETHLEIIGGKPYINKKHKTLKR